MEIKYRTRRKPGAICRGDGGLRGFVYEAKKMYWVGVTEETAIRSSKGLSGLLKL